MTSKEKKQLKDMQAWIQFCLDEGMMGQGVCLAWLGHDVNGIFANETGFCPRSSGYAERVKKIKFGDISGDLDTVATELEGLADNLRELGD